MEFDKQKADDVFLAERYLKAEREKVYLQLKNESRREKKEEAILMYIKGVVQSDVQLMARLRGRWQEEYHLHRFIFEFIKHIISDQEQGARNIIQEIERNVLDVEFKELLIDLAVEVQEIYSILAMKYFGTDLKKMKLEKQY
jgi:hypothetical protein